MEPFVQTVLQISISIAAVIGLLLLLVPVWQKRYSARWRKVIWLVIAIRLLVPFSLELPDAPVTMNMNLEEQTGLTIPVREPVYADTHYDMAVAPENQSEITNPEPQSYMETDAVSPVPVTMQQQEPVSYGTILFAVWIIGAVAFALWHGVQYAAFRRRVLASAMPLEDGEWLLQNAGKNINLPHLPDILISAEVQGPMLTGFLKPVILLPERIYGEQELLLILRHELMHYKHYDLWYKLVLLLANAVHWFNPLVWLMNRQAGRDLEQVCDDAVVAGQDMDYRKAYSMTILNTMASQRGIALSTYLSKEAQNTKKRFAGILQPKQYKKGVIVLAGVILLAIAASGCLQIGEADKGLEAYEKVAEFLPEDAIHDPSVYEVMGEADDEYIWYIWIEGAYEVTKEEAREAQNDGALSYGRDGKAYLYDRALMLCIYQKDGSIVSMGYDNRQTDTVKPSEIGLDKEKRDNYVQKIAETLIEDGQYLVFEEQHVVNDTDGNATRGTYTSGTMADIEMYEIRLNYQHGYLEKFMYYSSEMWEQGRTFRQYDITIEGMTETVDLMMNRQPDYYVMFTDAEEFDTQLNGISRDGSFCDEYVLHNKDALIKTYMKVGFVPDCTVEQWMNRVGTDSDYAKYRPQHNPLSSAWLPEWELTGEQKVFPEDTVRTWQVLSANRDGVINTCYVTSYRDGVMAAVLSYPVEYEEGWGTRMQQMMGTLVLAARGDYPQNSTNDEISDVGVALYNQVAPWLPENAVEDVTGYIIRKVESIGATEYIWGQDKIAMLTSSQYPAERTHPYGLTIRVDDESGEILSFDYDYDKDQITLNGKNPSYYAQLDDAESCLKLFAESFIEDGETLTFQQEANQPAWQYYTAIDEENHYKYWIGLQPRYGYICSFAKRYYNEELKEQAEAQLREEYQKQLGDAYQFSSTVFQVEGEAQLLKERVYKMLNIHTVYWRPKLNEQQQQQIEELREKDAPQYQLLADNLERLYSYRASTTIEGKVNWLGNLSGIKLYRTETEALDDAYWNLLEDKLQIMWTAASYANAWEHQYTDAMALFGIVNGVEFSAFTYDDYQHSLVEACQGALINYDGSNHVLVELPIHTGNRQQYLQMNLEKMNDTWRVTDAVLKRG